MRLITLFTVILLTGCGSMDKFVCTGTGTCQATGAYSGQSAAWVSPTPQTIITNNGTYMVGRSQSTGSINSVISVSKGK